MKLNIVLIGITCGLFYNATVEAQQITQGTRKAVVVHLRAPEKARWLVTLNPRKNLETDKDPGDDGGQSTTKRLPYEKRIQVTKQKDVIFEQIFMGDGRRFEKWCVGEYQYPITPGAKMERAVAYTRSSFSGTPNPLLFTDYSQSDFPGAEWLKGKTPSGEKKILGRDCLVFSEGTKTAYVDANSLYPMVLHDDGKAYLIQFQATPPGELSLPSLIVQDQQKRAEAAKRLGVN